MPRKDFCEPKSWGGVRGARGRRADGRLDNPGERHSENWGKAMAAERASNKCYRMLSIRPPVGSADAITVSRQFAGGRSDTLRGLW